jgi:hypothetical protein
MKHLFICLLIFKSTFSFGQVSQEKDSIEQPVYDTMNVEIKSINSFYFCSKLYKIPRNCNNNDQSKCCSYTTRISKFEKVHSNGQISCYDGTSLSWSKFDDEETAKENFEGLPTQMKQQMKYYKQDFIQFFVFDKEVKAYRQTCTTQQDYNFVVYIFYGTINGESILGRLSVKDNVTSSKELSPLFQQLVKF